MLKKIAFIASWLITGLAGSAALVFGMYTITPALGFITAGALMLAVNYQLAKVK
jgi:hypothetical protein